MSCPNTEHPTSYFKEVFNAGKTFAVTCFTSSSLCPEYKLLSVHVGRKNRPILCVQLVHFYQTHHTGVRMEEYNLSSVFPETLKILQG